MVFHHVWCLVLCLGIRSALAVTIIVCFYLSSKNRALDGIYKQAHQYDLACLSLAFTVFWAYISFSQYFLIYRPIFLKKHFGIIREINPNTGEQSGWFWVSMGLIFGHFFFPFLYLLFYQNKINGPRLVFIVSWILVFTTRSILEHHSWTEISPGACRL